MVLVALIVGLGLGGLAALPGEPHAFTVRRLTRRQLPQPLVAFLAGGLVVGLVTGHLFGLVAGLLLALMLGPLFAPPSTERS
jgi:hypothetical protein